jgi:hypothetical protein
MVLNTWLDEVDNALPMAEDGFNQEALFDFWEAVRNKGIRTRGMPVVDKVEIYYPGKDI